MNSHFEKLFETGVDEMSWDDTVTCGVCNNNVDILIAFDVDKFKRTLGDNNNYNITEGVFLHQGWLIVKSSFHN